MNGKTAALLAVAAALAAGAWLLVGGLGGGWPVPGGAPGPESGGQEGAAGAAEKPAMRAAAASGILEGVVLREGRPAAATVTARLTHRGPAKPDSADAWRALWVRTDLHDGIEAEARASVAAGEDGKWSFRGLGPGEFHFEARAADGARGSVLLQLRADGTPVPFDGTAAGPPTIELRAGTCVLRGRALLPGGSPFEGFVAASADDEPPPARTDAQGRFRIEGLPPRMVRLTAFVPGRRRLPGPSVILPCDSEIEFTVGAGLEDVAGLVVEDATGHPVPGADLDVTQSLPGAEDEGVENLRADEAGRFLLRLHAARSATVEVRAAGFVPRSEEIPEAGASRRKALEIRLLRPASLSGKVVAEGGAPAAGAVIVVVPEARVPGAPETGWRATADAQGRYALADLPPGPAVVLVAGGRFLSRSLAGPEPWYRREDTVVLPADGAATRDITVVPCARARGRVLDADGGGLAGASVEATQAGAHAQEDLPSGMGPSGGIETGADGTFAVPYLLPGFPCVYTVSLGGRRLLILKSPPVAPGAEAEVLLRAPRDRMLDVRVVEEGTGRPLPGIHVDVEALFTADDDDSDDVAGDWITGADGTARVGPVPALALVVRAAGRDPWWFGRRVRVGESVDGPVVLAVDPLEMPGALLIEGRVLGPDGAAAAGVQVTCDTHGEWPRAPFTGEDVRTDPQGRFRIPGLHPGRYEVSARDERSDRNFLGDAKAEAGDREIVITVKDEARAEAGFDDAADGEPRLRFRLVAPGGKPVPTADVQVLLLDAEGDTSSRGLTVCDGQCMIALEKSNEGGSVWIEVSNAVLPGDPPLRPAHALLGPWPSAPGLIEVTLPEGLAVKGRVVDPEGRGIADAVVDLLRELKVGPGGEFEWTGEVSSANTDPEGRFTIEGLGDREYDLVAGAGEEWGGSKKVRVRGGAEDVLLTLRPARAPLVTVLDPQGRPVPEARVSAEQGREYGGWSREKTTNAAGMVRVPGFDHDAPAELTITPPEERGDLLPWTQERWSPADTVVHLDGGHVLVVKVVDPAGRPVPNARVQQSRDPGRKDPWTSSRTDGEGVVTLPRLAPGRLLLRAALPDDSVLSPETAVETAAGEVTLVLDPGLEIRLKIRLGDAAAARGWGLIAARGSGLLPGEASSPRRVRVRNGEARIRGLAAGTEYDLYLGDAGGEHSAFLKSLRAGGEPVDVVLAPGREIRGTVVGPRASEVDEVRVMAGEVALTAVFDRETGAFSVTGLPPGRWKVRARIMDGERESFAEGEVESGGSVEIEAR